MTAAARLDLRLSPDDKDRIARAAKRRGVPLSQFVREAALRQASLVQREVGTVVLTAAETRRLLEAAGERALGRYAKVAEALASGASVQLDRKTVQGRGAALVEHLRGRATTPMSTDEIMRLTRGA